MFYKKKKRRRNIQYQTVGDSDSTFKQPGQITKVGVYIRYLALALIVWFPFILYSLCFKLSFRNGFFFYPFNFYFSIEKNQTNLLKVVFVFSFRANTILASVKGLIFIYRDNFLFEFYLVLVYEIVFLF